MKIFLTCLITAGTFIFSCNKKDESASPLAYSDSMDGKYRGIKIFSNSQQGNSAPGDTVKVSLTITKQTNSSFGIKGIVPTEQIVTAQLGSQNRFSYDRGVGEDQCGLTTMTGEGYFRGDSLYITETIQCTSSASNFVRTIRIKAVKAR
ncbi:hypothetical protein [Telluribacter sp.]|jgi:hypothetical protein|uniref:hypothetical protein n=1 Tax=Telluribacter sp. TaxID=1978767 RepID=UPI002E0D814D|nr:hypothetical protein [Telluribacter sp.]